MSGRLNRVLRSDSSVRLRRVLIIAPGFIVACTPVAALALMLTLALVGAGIIKPGLARPAWLGLFALACFLPLRRMIFAGPAAADDLLAGIRRTCFGAIAWLSVVAGAFAVGTVLLLLSGQPGLLPSRANAPWPDYMPVMIAICLVNALIGCTMLRDWILAPLNADRTPA